MDSMIYSREWVGSLLPMSKISTGIGAFVLLFSVLVYFSMVRSKQSSLTNNVTGSRKAAVSTEKQNEPIMEISQVLYL